MRRLVLISLIIAGLLALIAIFWKNEETAADISIIVYHNVRPDNNAGPSELFITPETFEEHLVYLRDNKYNPILFADLLDFFESGAALPENPVIISFDDSRNGQFINALPLLQKFGFKATFFIWSDVIGREGFMTWDEIRALKNAGMEIGGHTLSHPHLIGLGPGENRKEILENKKIIEQEIDGKIYTFSYPYGEYSEKIIEIVKGAGYKIARAIGSNKIMSQKKLFQLGGFVVTEDFGAFTKYLPDEAGRWRTEMAHLKNRIQKIGAKTAYEEFKISYKDKAPGAQHIGAHVFGEALYDLHGTAGIAVCDGDFVFGCYHGFLGEAISEQGLEIMPELDLACIKSGWLKLACHHGIGHGIVGYLGQENLLKALKTCTKLSHGLIGGCTTGVFMEYSFLNTHNITDPESFVRKFAGNPYEPCDTLPDIYKTSCFYFQPIWWSNVFANDFEKIGELCSAVSSGNHKEFCFLGSGKAAAPSSRYDFEETKNYCAKMPGNHEIALCRAGAFLSLIDYNLDAEKSIAICDDLNSENRKTCYQKANLFGTAPRFTEN